MTPQPERRPTSDEHAPPAPAARPASPPALARVWPLHERLLGASVRAGAVLFLVLALALCLHPRRLGGWDAPTLLALALVVLCTCVLERRDARPASVLGRAALAPLLAALTLPATLIALEHVGDPRGALGALAQGLGRVELREAPSVGVGAVFAALLWWGAAGPLLLARAASERLAVHVAATSVAPLVLCWHPPARPFLLVSVLVPIAALCADMAMRRRDPSAPRPRLRDTRALAGAVLPLLVLSPCALLLLLDSHGLIEARKGLNECTPIGSLKTIASAQALFRESDKEKDGLFDYATSLQELGDAQVIDSVLATGIKQGYYFRLIASPTTGEFLWTAAADPIVPGVTGDRSFVINQQSVVFYTGGGPLPLDAWACTLRGTATGR